MIKFGIIGLGRLGRIHATNIISNVEFATVESVSDARIEEAKGWAKENGVSKVHENWHNVVEDPAVDAVVIASPTALHAKMVMEAVKNGKHVFVEKPLSVDSRSAKEVVDYLKDNEVKVQVGFNRRFDKGYRKLHEKVKDGEIGEVYLLRSTIRDPELPALEFVKSSGGIFFDFFIHEFDNVRYITADEVVEVYAGGSVLWDKRIEKLKDFDTAFAMLRMSSGALALIDSSRKSVYGYDQRLEVYGSKGSAKLMNKRETYVEFKNASGTRIDKPLKNFQERYADSFICELSEFVSCIRGDKIPSVTPLDGYKAILIAEAALKSSLEGRKIMIDELTDTS